MNLEIFRQNLIDIINSCELPPGAAYYVFKDVLRELEKVYIEDISSPSKEEVISEEPLYEEINPITGEKVEGDKPWTVEIPAKLIGEEEKEEE